MDPTTSRFVAIGLEKALLRRLANGVGANLLDRLAVSVVQIASVPALAGTWGASKYGLWLMLSTVPSYLALSDLGFATAAGVQMTMHVARGEHKRAVAVQHSARLALSIVGILLASAIWLAVLFGLIPANAFGASADLHVPLTIAVLSTYGVLVLQGGIAAVTLRSDGLYATGSVITTIINVVEQAVMVFCVLYGGGLLAAALCLLLCRACGVVLLGQAVKKKMPWVPSGFRHANLADLKALYGPAQATVAITLANASFLQGITLAVGFAATAASVPVFNVTRTMVRLGIQMTNVLSSALAPEFSAKFASGEQKTLAIMIASVLIFSFVILVPAAVIMMIFGRTIVDLWSVGKIQATQPIVVVMSVVMIFNGAWMPISAMIVSTNKQSSFSYYFFGFAVSSVVMAYFLALLYGPLGGAIANLALDMAMTVVVFTASRRILAGRSQLLSAFGEVFRRSQSFFSQRRR